MLHGHDFDETPGVRRLIALAAVVILALSLAGALAPASGHAEEPAPPPTEWVPEARGALVPGTHYVVGPDGVLVPVQSAPQPAIVQAEAIVAPSPAPVLTASQIRERCEHHAWAARQNNGRIVKNGLFGGVLGAGMGAAIGAIAGGGSGAGKGAGIGALAGVAGGSLYGYDRESRRAEQARQAYQACLARYGL